MPPKKRPAKIRPQITIEKPPVEDLYWHNEIEEMIKQGYSYKMAYALVSKKKIRELFEKDVKIINGR